MLQANPTLTFRYLCEEKNVFKAYFCTFYLRMRGPWYATKRLFASFATSIFQKICRAPPMAKNLNMVWGPHIARVLCASPPPRLGVPGALVSALLQLYHKICSFKILNCRRLYKHCCHQQRIYFA